VAHSGLFSRRRRDLRGQARTVPNHDNRRRQAQTSHHLAVRAASLLLQRMWLSVRWLSVRWSLLRRR